MIQFTVNYELPTLNEYINLERRNKYAAAKLKKVKTESVAFLAKAQCVKLENILYDIEVTWYRKNKKHDADNVYFSIKFILDGLVKAKILQSDGRKNIRDISHKIRPDSHNYCIVIFKEAW